MREIDLVPDDYREYLRLIRRAKNAVVCAIVTTMVMGVGHTVLSSAVDGETEAITILQQKQSVTNQQRLELEKLRTMQAGLERRLALLDGLRGGPTARSMMLIVDHAVSGGDIWFTQWRFRRAGTEVDHDGASTNTGYFVVLPADTEHPEAKAWKVDTHMEIKGQALDHSALSNFVSRLYDHPEIEDAKVLRTTTRRYTRGSLIDFEVAVVVAGDRKKPGLAIPPM